MIGDMLGPYRVLEKLGEGGMGEVYKAQDTRLDRTVAIKILPPEVAADPERRVRFEHEAKTIAALAHPHICVLHDVGYHDGSLFLVMEHLSGETLAQRLRKGPLPLEQALDVAGAIADAIAAAHRQGIIHRDIKPGNVILTKSGAKLLDFGLAKLKPQVAGLASATISALPTQEPVTARGTILGTIPYMAPEQLEGREADARSDIFSFGAVLYEMLAGKRAFDGKSQVSIIAAILEREPAPVSSLQPLTPPPLERVVRKCLAKSPGDRWQSAADLADDLRWLHADAANLSMPRTQGRPAGRRSRILLALFGLTAALVGAGIGSWLWSRWGASVAFPPVTRAFLGVEPAEELNAGGFSPLNHTAGGTRTSLCWTPDGKSLVFVGRRSGAQQLYLRRLDQDEAAPLAGTEGAQAPAVSPDGKWVAFWADGALKKTRLDGGPIEVIAPGLKVVPYGLVWADDETLYFGRDRNTGGTIWRVSGKGAPAQVTTRSEGETWHALPWLLPGGQFLLFTAGRGEFTWGGEELIAQDLTTGARRVLLKNAIDARYVSPGYLVFMRRGQMFGVPFDPRTLVVEEGRAVALLDDVAQAVVPTDLRDLSGAGQFAVSSTGTLAWARSPVPPFPLSTVATVDREGRVSALGMPDKPYGSRMRLAPGGRQLAVTVRGLTEMGVWIHDLLRHTTVPVLQDGECMAPIWTPDGKRLVFKWLKDGRISIAWLPIDGSAGPKVLAAGSLWPSSWTPDGRRLAVFGPDDQSLTILSIEANRTSARQGGPKASKEKQASPEFSPDGHWLAYSSDTSGRWEIYVQSYPDANGRTALSIDGGVNPAWRGDSRALFFVEPGNSGRKPRMMEVEFKPGTPPAASSPRPLFEIGDDLRFPSTGDVRGYDVTPDGRLFFALQMRTTPVAPTVTRINLIQNWLEELKTKLPVRR